MSWTKLIGWCIRHPYVAAWGAWEYQSEYFASSDGYNVQMSYDAGREVMHRITRRKYDHTREDQ